jgi:DNA-binding CsgD family transcriptional regulator
LTARERQIVSCVLRGQATQEIATELTISPNTVQAHLTAVFAKTGLRSRRELIARLQT